MCSVTMSTSIVVDLFSLYSMFYKEYTLGIIEVALFTDFKFVGFH